MTDHSAAGVRWASTAEVVPHVAAALARPGAKTFALAGGSTPAPFYRQLAALDLPWADATLVPTDERCVPVDHDANNFSMLQRIFETTGAVLTPLTHGVILPRLDLAWLGVGPDGHIASLFPNVVAESKQSPIVAVVPDPLPPEAPYPRLSLSLATLAAAREIVLVITGDAKRRIVEAAIEGGDLPVARLLRATTSPVTIFWSPA